MRHSRRTFFTMSNSAVSSFPPRVFCARVLRFLCSRHPPPKRGAGGAPGGGILNWRALVKARTTFARRGRPGQTGTGLSALQPWRFWARSAHSVSGVASGSVARAELAWWVARRTQGQNSAEQVGKLIAREYELLYDVPSQQLFTAGFLRAQAGALRDAQAQSPDWYEIARLLQQSYIDLRTALSTENAALVIGH